MNESDWRTLEKIAPRPMWERISRLKRHFMSRDPNFTGSKKLAHGIEKRPRPKVRSIPVVDRPDGRIQMVYRLRNYGGATVQSRYDGGTARRDIKVQQAELGPLVKVISEQLAGQGSVSALPSENALVITCEKAMRQPVLQLLADLDGYCRQVEITARVFEISHDFDFQYGARALIEHISSDNSQNLISNFSTQGFLESVGTAAASGGTGFQGSILRLVQTFADAGITIDATFEALADMGLIKVVATPRMTVAAGKTGYVLAGQELPIQSAKISNDKLVTEKTTYKPVGVQLYITPQAIGDQDVKIHVATTVSAVSGFGPTRKVRGAQSAEPLVNPIIDTREAETVVAVPDGHTLVMGGLRMVRTVTRERKVPGLGDIQGVEWLFKNHRSQNSVNDLYFFITPRILTGLQQIQ